MTTAPGRGYGRIPYGRGRYGRAMTIAGDNDAEGDLLTLDGGSIEGAASSGVSAEGERLTLESEGGEGIGLVPPSMPIPAGRNR